MKTRSAPAGGKPDRKKVLTGIGGTLLAIAVVAVFELGFYPAPLVGMLVGSAFALLGVWIVFLVFGPYETRYPWVVPLQALGRLAFGALLIFLGGLGVVSATSSMRPSLVWEQPRFGDLRTLFWKKEAFAEMACHRVEDGPPEALAFALERAPPGQVYCGGGQTLMDRAEDDEILELLIRARRFDQSDLDSKLLALAWQDRRLAIESLVAAGANPNAVLGDQTALGSALLNHQLSLAVWLLEHGAQANQTFADGSSLLDLAKNVDQVDKRETYVALLLRHGAAEAPRLEQHLPAGRR